MGVQDLAHIGREGTLRKRLLQKRRRIVETVTVKQLVIGVARHVQYFDAGPQKADASGNLTTVYISLNAAVVPNPVRFLEAVRRLRETATKAGRERPRVAVCGDGQVACGRRVRRMRQFSSNNFAIV